MLENIFRKIMVTKVKEIMTIAINKGNVIRRERSTKTITNIIITQWQHLFNNYNLSEFTSFELQ